MRRRIVKRLPRTITRAAPETLAFLSTDRYPAGPANELAEQDGLTRPDINAALTQGSDYLAVTRFGKVCTRTV